MRAAGEMSISKVMTAPAKRARGRKDPEMSTSKHRPEAQN